VSDYSCDRWKCGLGYSDSEASDDLYDVTIVAIGNAMDLSRSNSCRHTPTSLLILMEPLL